MKSIQTTKDGKHKFVSSNNGWQILICRYNAQTVKFKYKGGVSHCPLCGNKFGKIEKRESYLNSNTN